MDHHGCPMKRIFFLLISIFYFKSLRHSQETMKQSKFLTFDYFFEKLLTFRKQNPSIFSPIALIEECTPNIWNSLKGICILSKEDVKESFNQQCVQNIQAKNNELSLSGNWSLRKQILKAWVRKKLQSPWGVL